MPGCTVGQVFTEKELERILDWYHVVGQNGQDVVADHNLAEKVRRYHLELAQCRVRSL
jgi:hypothetical protein